jgi:hypothetical protein
MRPALRLLPALLSLALLAGGCGRSEPAAIPGTTAKKHEHKSPHGGTAVELGEEAFHVEFVPEEPGRLSAYVLDGELENFIRIAAPSFEIVATVGGQKLPLVFRAVASTATGETVGSTSHFLAEADWLKTTPAFDAVLTQLEVRGSTFSGIAFNFPKGKDQ